jgi:hypothetical protein
VELVENAAMLRDGQFLELSLPVSHGQIVVAMGADERAPPRDLNGDVERDLRGAHPAVERLAEGAVFKSLDVSPPIRR